MSQIAVHNPTAPSLPWAVTAERATSLAVPVGRALFAAIFVSAGIGHFGAESIGYAAAAGVPFASILVPASGVLSLLGGLSILVGYRARLGALALIAFLIPVTVAMHPFWSITDPMMQQMHQVMFFKNLGLLGGALLIGHFGAGPYSVDARRRSAQGQ